MATIAERLEAATLKAEQASDICEGVANLPVGSYITTNSGSIPSLAEFLAKLLPNSLDFYTDTTSGLAGTVDGDFFNVIGDPLSDDVYTLYRNDGGVATEIAQAPSINFINRKNAEVVAYISSLVGEPQYSLRADFGYQSYVIATE